MTDSIAAPVSDVAADDRLRAHKAWRSAEIIKRLSDRLIGVGPVGIGLDGVLAWVPGVGLAYGLGAGALLLTHGYRAKAMPATLVRMAAYLAIDNITDAIPVAGWAVDTLFPGHLMAAKALQKDIEARHGLPDDVAAERAKPTGRRWWSGRAPSADRR